VKRNKNRPTYEIKVAVVKSILSGMKYSTVSSIHDVHTSTISRWVKLYRDSNDYEVLKRQHGGGASSIIDSKLEKKLFKLLLKSASYYGFENDLWNTTRILKLIKQIFKIKISRSTIWRLLVKNNFSYKKAEKNYHQGSEIELEKWLKTTLPQIKELAKKKRSIVYYEDEAKISLTTTVGKTWSPVKKRAVVKVTGNRGGINAISAITSSGQLQFNLLNNKTIASKQVIEFLTQLLKHHKKRYLIVVMDQAPCHTSNAVKKFEKSKKRLKIFYLPAYWPKLNPDEKVWNHLKNYELNSHQAKNRDELLKLTTKKLKVMSKDEKLIRGIFLRCEYANQLK